MQRSENKFEVDVKPTCVEIESDNSLWVETFAA